MNGSMKAYVICTGLAFGVLTVLHIWRAMVESHVATQPWFILLTVIAAFLCGWAFRLVWRWPRS